MGVDAAVHTGVGMVRYVGPARASDHVLARRPEAVAGVGRVQAWLVGSGISAPSLDALDPTTADGFRHASDDGVRSSWTPARSRSSRSGRSRC